MRVSQFLLVAACAMILAGVSADARVHQKQRSSLKSNGIQYTPAALQDQIHNLPGLAVQPTFNMFSGYLVVDNTTQRSIFYWYTESQKAPATDPLLWWSNGGPGCSGLLGFLTEHGPFRPQAAPATGLDPNPFAFNTLANTLYVEAPAGVGFSFSNNQNDYTTGDAQTAKDNFVAIQQFFLRFPHLQSNDFYISAESYGGHYVPTLAQVILNEGSLSNFRGFLLGNPLTDMDENTNWGQAGTLCGHSLASRPTCDSFSQHCLGASGPDGWCTLAQAGVVAEAGGLDAYGLDYPTCGESAETRRLLHHTYQMKKLAAGFPEKFKAQLDSIPADYDPCMESEETAYLNRADVRTALHVNPAVGAWVSCSNAVNYNQTDVSTPMEPIYTFMLNFKTSTPLRMVIFSGDDDSVCASLGTQHWMFNMLGKNVVKAWSTWEYESAEYGTQIGGYSVGFQGPIQAISFVTVHDAGHMVSGYQPERGLAVLANFLNGVWQERDADHKLEL
jgi:carboxypeptidase C (cathepsin A)